MHNRYEALWYLSADHLLVLHCTYYTINGATHTGKSFTILPSGRQAFVIAQEVNTIVLLLLFPHYFNESIDWCLAWLLIVVIKYYFINLQENNLGGHGWVSLYQQLSVFRMAKDDSQCFAVSGLQGPLRIKCCFCWSIISWETSTELRDTWPCVLWSLVLNHR